MSQQILARIASVEEVAERIRLYTLVAADGSRLPRFTPGAHIDLTLGNALTRQYSLCNSCEENGDADDRHRYQIAVYREPESRGGSDYIHRHVQAGDQLLINRPRNHFELDESGDHYLLLAGGIGITPLIPMARRLKRLGRPFSLHYLCRTPQQAAFRTLVQDEFAEQIHFHFSQQDGRVDIDTLLADCPQGTRVYTCGSERLLQTIIAAAENHHNISLHFERFSAAPPPDASANRAFEIELNSNGKVLRVDPEQSILEVLRSDGHQIETMCEEGLCGSCEVGLLGGDAEHRDSVLTDEEKAEQSVLMVCCSRARSERLKLDL